MGSGFPFMGKSGGTSAYMQDASGGYMGRASQPVNRVA